MADIQQVTGQVNSACSRYKEDQAKMQRASGNMANFRNQAERAERELSRVDGEIGDIEDEIRSLEAEASRNSGEEGSDNSYIYSQISSLRDRKRSLMEQSSRLESEMSQARANYQRAQSEYNQAQQDANTVRSYLVNVKSQMMQAGEVFKTKIKGFDDSIQILGSASGNMFGSSATSQIGNLQSSRNANQANLNIAISVVNQINSTLGLQGGISNVAGGSSARGFSGDGSVGANGFSAPRGSASGGFSASGFSGNSASGSRAGTNVQRSSGGASYSGGSSGYSGSGSSSAGDSNSEFFAAIMNDSSSQSNSASVPASASSPTVSSGSSFMPTGTVPRTLSHTAYTFSPTSNGQAVWDSPVETGQYLVSNQGSAYESFQGTCGLCSTANVLRLAGMNIGEKEIIDYASSGGFFSKLCSVDLSSPESSGGTTPEQRQAILEHFGVSSRLMQPEIGMNGRISESTIEDIGRSVSEGRGVIISVDAGEFYDDPRYNGCGHALTVTSVTRGPYQEVAGFHIADSNGGTVYVETAKLREALRPRPINVTNTIIR